MRSEVLSPALTAKRNQQGLLDAERRSGGHAPPAVSGRADGRIQLQTGGMSGGCGACWGPGGQASGRLRETGLAAHGHWDPADTGARSSMHTPGVPLHCWARPAEASPGQG